MLRAGLIPVTRTGYCPLAGHVITADAARTVRAHARLICEDLPAHYVFTVKLNTPGALCGARRAGLGEGPRLVAEERTPHDQR